MSAINKTKVAEEIPFDNDTNGFVSEDIQAAIEELDDKVGVSASPGFTWGRSGTRGAGTWLLNENVPSNRTGRTVNLLTPSIVAFSIANEDISTFEIGIYEHDGDSINLSLLGTIPVTAARSANGFISFPLTQGKQIAIRVETGTARNIVVGLQLAGTTA